MPKTPSLYVPDGFSALEAGVDSGRRPFFIGKNQVAFAGNCTFRDGLVKNRPPYNKITLSHSDDSAAVFGNSRFQGLGVYDPDQGDDFLVIALDGRFFRISIGSVGAVQEITPLQSDGVTLDSNPSNRFKTWFVQGENYLTAQDGQSTPLIFNGATMRRAGLNEIKTGTVGAYGMGRFWFGTPGGRGFRGYDLVGGPSGSPSVRRRDAVLKDTENTFLNEGGDFSVPNNAGPISAMRFVSVLDTSTGQGPLLVLTTNSVFSVNAPVDRTIWKDVTFPIQTISLVERGALSQDATVTVNGDVFYRSLDGLRSFIIAQRRFRQWGNTPMSAEMGRVFDFDSKPLLELGSAVLFDNRYLSTCSPASSDHGIYHRGLAVIDFDLISSMQQTFQPAWEGVWTGIKILQIVKATIQSEERCFAAVLNDDGGIEIWEILKEGIADNGTTRIPSYVESRALDFKSQDQLKDLKGGFLRAMELYDTVDFTLKWKPDQYPAFLDWVSWSECATVRDCTPAECIIKNLKPQFRPRMKFPEPPEGCDPITNRPYSHCYETQIRLGWTGAATIRSLAILASPRTETIHDDCLPIEPTCSELNVCATPDFQMT